jgi:LysM repeat protein
MRYFLVLFLCISHFAFAQQEKTVTHKVSKGETITQIAKLYNVTPQDIYKLNPDAQNGIQEEAVLLIPNDKSFSYNFKKKLAPVVSISKKHEVLPKETLYGISKLYNVSVSDIEIANSELLKAGIQSGQVLIIPEKAIQNPEVKQVVQATKAVVIVKPIVPVAKPVVVVENTKKPEPVEVVTDNVVTKNTHLVLAKENLFSIARLYNVSVQDLDNANTDILKDGLQIGETIVIPNKKKTLNGQARIINKETVFHIVVAKETKFSIAKKYGVSIEQLESQNPEIVNGLVEGNRLAINVKKIKPSSDNEELMVALAEKQVAIEKTKAKTLEIEDLQDKLTVQKQMNQKVLKVNSLKVNLNEIDETKGGSTEKLRLVLEANKNVQEILISKLDSLVVTMGDDLEILKKTEIVDLEDSKKMERESYKSIGQTNEMLVELKRDLADNRKIYSGLMSKVQRITFDKNHEFKKKVRENSKASVGKDDNDTILLDAIKNIQTEQEKNDQRNSLLLTKIDSLGVEKNAEIKRRIGKASFYSTEAREYDDKLALVKLKRYQNQIVQKEGKKDQEVKPTSEEIGKVLKNQTVNEDETVKMEVLKNLKEVKNGFYLVANVFSEAEPRDKFVMKLTDSGEINSSFFYNINIFSYYVYTKTFDKLEEVMYEYKLKEKNELFTKMFILQVDNQ